MQYWNWYQVTYLFNEFPKVSEGELTKTRASMVCEPSLAMCARDIGLGDYLASWKRRRGDRWKKKRFYHI